MSIAASTILAMQEMLPQAHRFLWEGDSRHQTDGTTPCDSVSQLDCVVCPGRSPVCICLQAECVLVVVISMVEGGLKMS